MANKKCKYCDKIHENNNTGCNNSGYWNSGNRNSGDWNSGNRNSGDWNSGNRNSGYWNSGIFNTDEPKMRAFNKETDMTYTEFREKFGYKEFYLPLCRWVELEDLPESEKTELAIQMGGVLKTLSYKDAWKKGWEEATQEQRDWFKSLPNFSEKIFEEITGIKVNDEKPQGKVVKIKLKDGQIIEGEVIE